MIKYFVYSFKINMDLGMTNKLLLWIVDGDCILISNCLVGFYCAFRVSSSRRRILDCLNNYRNMNSSNNIGEKKPKKDM